MTATRTDGARLLNNQILPRYRSPGDPMSPATYATQHDAPTSRARRGTVDAGEQIAREKRPQHGLAPPRVADLGTVARQIRGIALPQQVLQRLHLGLRLGVDGIPRHHRPASAATASTNAIPAAIG